MKKEPNQAVLRVALTWAILFGLDIAPPLAQIVHGRRRRPFDFCVYSRCLFLFRVGNALVSFFNMEPRGGVDLDDVDFSCCLFISISPRTFVIFPGGRYSESGFHSVIPSCQ